jgi:hypothetical protein
VAPAEVTSIVRHRSTPPVDRCRPVPVLTTWRGDGGDWGMNKKSILGWVIFFVLIGLANLLSYLFHWGFWVY